MNTSTTFTNKLRTWIKRIFYILTFLIILVFAILLMPLNLMLKTVGFFVPEIHNINQLMVKNTDLFTRNNGYNTIFSGNLDVLLSQKYPITQVKWTYLGNFSEPLKWQIHSIDLKKPIELLITNNEKSTEKHLQFSEADLTIPLQRIQGLLPLSQTFNFTGNTLIHWDSQTFNFQNTQQPNYLQGRIFFKPFSFERLKQRKTGFYEIDVRWEQTMNQTQNLTLQLITPNPQNSDYILDGLLNYQSQEGKWNGNLKANFPDEDSDFMMNQVLPFLPQNHNIQLNLEQKEISLFL